MKFRTTVEPPEPTRGLEVPSEVVESLGQGKRPPVTITINGHSWRSRVAIMRGRYLLGLSNANRRAAGVEIGDEVEVELEFDPEPRVVTEPADFARALGADPIARAAYERLPDGRKREHVRTIESAKKPETRRGRIEKALAALRGSEPAGRGAARGATRASKPTSGES
ncbi:MAG TPA: YdeI/OmpD-associated family protein [Gaiellaceae bacterium]|nr:YdeI/OmpD-associated family protein [Gaiellaceae bacterium]